MSGEADGQLLIAGPRLLDPNFWRTVVLIVQHDDEGAFGLVLNRPSDTTVGDAVPLLGALLAFDDIGVLGSGSDPAELTIGVRAARAFAGHAGWGPGQLDEELDRDDWILEAPLREDAFSAAPRDLWASVLTRKGGSYALVARLPPDPSVN